MMLLNRETGQGARGKSRNGCGMILLGSKVGSIVEKRTRLTLKFIRKSVGGDNLAQRGPTERTTCTYNAGQRCIV